MHARNKLGISPVLGYVLLITLVVSLAGFVTYWYRGVSEEQLGSTLERFQNTEECNEVKYELVYEYGECRIAMYNLGKFKIDKVQADFYMPNGEHETMTQELNILPKYGQYLEDIPDFERMKVTPILIRGNKEISCTSDREFSSREGFDGCP